MKRTYNLKFAICSLNICFDSFEEEYVEFFEKLYSPYIDNNSRGNSSFTITLTKNDGSFFSISPNFTSAESHDIHSLYNIVHYLICNYICTYCDDHKLLVLHASSFYINEKLVLLAGVKSSGKTTTLLYFLKNGAIYAGDEIIVVSPNGVIPYQLPIRMKVNTAAYLSEKYNYKFNVFPLPTNINNKKQYVSDSNGFERILIYDWVKCDTLIFLNEGEKDTYQLKKINEFEAINGLLKCVRNKGDVAAIISLIKGANLYSADFSVPLDKMQETICG